MPSLLSVLLLAGTAQAKDLRGRAALGVDTWFGDMPALSVRYGLPTGSPTANFQIELNAGTSLYDARKASTGGLRLLYSVVAEDHMNLYVGAGAGLLSDDAGNRVRIQPAMVADFFLFGLENLGLSAGLGLNLDAGTNESGLATTGAVLGGVHYWF